jgi:porin
LFLAPYLQAYDVNEKLSIGALVVGAGQCQELSEGAGKPDACRGALPIRPNLRFRPTKQDEFYTEFGFAAGNGLNDVSPFEIAPWAADLEDDVKDINGRGRNYLLTAWYRHRFQLGEDSTLSATLGLIDSTDFLDNNAFANDEYTQFMNEAFVNSPEVFQPSYDLGTGLQWDVGTWSLRAVYMNVGKDEDKDENGDVGRLTDRDMSDDYNFVGAEIGFSVQTALGEGSYRLIYTMTSKDFLDPKGVSIERQEAAVLSFDQELGPNLGAFLRIGGLADKAAVNHDSFFSGGLHICGRLWGREKDNIGLGAAYLYGGNQDIKNTRIAEAYYRFVITGQFGLSADTQYMKDDKKSGKDPEGVIMGLRVDAHF